MLSPKTSSSNKKSLVDEKKNQSQSKILKYLYTKGSGSIAQLAKHLHTSIPSATFFVNDLLEKKFLKPTGQNKTKSGRRPVFFAIDGTCKNILVVDINIYKVSIYLTDLDNKIISNISFKKEISDKGYVNFLIEKLKEQVANTPEIWAIGISAPGLINKNSEINSTHPSLNFSPSVSLSNHVKKTLGIDCFILNDTQASIIGEHHYGLAKGKKNVLSVNLDWGMAIGVMVNGKVLNGHNGFAGELGHIQIDPNGTLCKCGKIGCLDTVASASTVVRRAKEGIKKGQLSTLSQIEGELDLQSVVNAAIKGDEFSIDILYDLGRELGKGLSVAIHLLNPEAIIIDGILTSAGELIVSTLNQSINKYCLNEFRTELAILVSPLKDKAKIYGAKSHVFLQKISV